MREGERDSGILDLRSFAFGLKSRNLDFTKEIRNTDIAKKHGIETRYRGDEPI
jgi:hypothetical protein